MRKKDYAKRRWRRCPLCGSKIRRSRAAKNWDPNSRWCDRCVKAKDAVKLLEQYDEPVARWPMTMVEQATGTALDHLAEGYSLQRLCLASGRLENDVSLRKRLINYVSRP